MIVLDDAGKAFRDRKGRIRWLFRHVTTAFPDGRSHGILAGRAEGKSTFINVLCGGEPLSEGEIHRKGGISYPLNFRANVSNKLSGRQNLRFLTDVYGRNFSETLDFCMAFSELGDMIDHPLSKYTNEARGRFVNSAIFALGFKHILVDEAIEGGDAKFRNKCRQYLRDNAERVTLLIASSDASLIAQFCQTASVLHRGAMTHYPDVESATAAFADQSQMSA